MEFKKVKNFVLHHLPDYSTTLDTLSKLENFNSTDDLDVNKVVLFTSKGKTPAIFKVLS